MLRPYPQTKDSRAAWLGHVPLHWDVVPNRAICSEIIDRDHPDEPMLSVTITRGVVEQAELLRESSKKDSSNLDRSAYKLVQPGDIAYNKMRAWQGAIGLSTRRGIVSPAYVVLRPRESVSGRYLDYLFRTPGFAKEAERWSYGITSDMWSLRPQGFRSIYSCVPPLPEQAAIVRLLDHVDRRIRRYIRAKQKLIELLEEQKQAIILHYVSRGLEPSARTSPSGLHFAELVPSHWNLRSFWRSAVERADYRGATPQKVDAGVFLVTARNIRRGWIDYKCSEEYVSSSDYVTIMRRGLPRTGDLLLTTEAPLGNAALVDREDVALAQRVIRFRMDPNLFVPRFVLFSVLSHYFQHQLAIRATGSTALGIKASKLPQLQLLQPPLREQRDILERIDAECGGLDQMLRMSTNEVSLLREYRTRLIADVVTGKLDVREAAARLPDEADGDPSVDPLDSEDPADGSDQDPESDPTE